MHKWGDTWFKTHGHKLDHAIQICMKSWRVLARLGSHGKEKFGTFRHDIYPFDGTLHSLIWPGYFSIQGNQWFYWNVDYRFIRLIMKYTGARWAICKWQWLVYNIVLWACIKRWPEIEQEILDEEELWQRW